VTYEDARQLAAAALACTSAGQVVDLCRTLMSRVAPEILELI
jgi:hypothetical protein